MSSGFIMDIVINLNELLDCQVSLLRRSHFPRLGHKVPQIAQEHVERNPR
jgi:hypothetical protein